MEMTIDGHVIKVQREATIEERKMPKKINKEE
jgi:hypothetical protein